MVTEHLLSSMKAAAASYQEWPQKVRATLSTLLSFLAAEPELARLCMIEPIAAGGEIAARYRASLQGLVEILKAGHPEPASGRPLPDATEETLVGGIVSLIVREISAGRADQLEKLLPDVVELTLSPFIGAEEAARIARH